jgi:hypothetical protein
MIDGKSVYHAVHILSPVDLYFHRHAGWRRISEI